MDSMSDKYHKLQILAERTWDLHGRINQTGFSFCTNCSNHGRYCVVANNTLEEKKLMFAIKDSLKDVHNDLIFLQRVKLSQEKGKEEALARLEESRKLVIDKMNQFPENHRKLAVLQELTSFLGDDISAFSWVHKSKEDQKVDQKSHAKGISRFLVRTTRFAIEFVVIFASIYSTVKFYDQSRKQGNSGDPSVLTGTENAKYSPDDSTGVLDVLRGMG